MATNGELNDIMSILMEIVDRKVFDLINDKIENGIVYFVSDQNNLQLPLINIKQLNDEKPAVLQQPVVLPEVSDPPADPSESKTE